MSFAVNYLAVIVAAVAAVAINALWYTVILKAQVNALRAGDATIAGRDPAPPMYGVAIVGQLLLSFVIAVVIKSTGVTGIGGGLLAGFVLWLGLSLPPVANTHHRIHGKPHRTYARKYPKPVVITARYERVHAHA